MSEYSFVEKSFLTQLEKLGWEVIDQGAHSVPEYPDFNNLPDNFKPRHSLRYDSVSLKKKQD